MSAPTDSPSHFSHPASGSDPWRHTQRVELPAGSAPHRQGCATSHSPPWQQLGLGSRALGQPLRWTESSTLRPHYPQTFSICPCFTLLKQCQVTHTRSWILQSICSVTAPQPSASVFPSVKWGYKGAPRIFTASFRGCRQDFPVVSSSHELLGALSIIPQNKTRGCCSCSFGQSKQTPEIAFPLLALGRCSVEAGRAACQAHRGVPMHAGHVGIRGAQFLKKKKKKSSPSGAPSSSLKPQEKKKSMLI